MRLNGCCGAAGDSGCNNLLYSRLFFCLEEHSAGCRIPFYSKRGIILVNEILVGFKFHPGGSPLFRTTHGVITKEPDLGKPCSRQPIVEAGGGGDKPGSGNLGISVGGKQGHRVITSDGLRFDKQNASGTQGGVQIT
jgi:hypothetical protein